MVGCSVLQRTNRDDGRHWRSDHEGRQDRIKEEPVTTERQSKQYKCGRVTAKSKSPLGDRHRQKSRPDAPIQQCVTIHIHAVINHRESEQTRLLESILETPRLSYHKGARFHCENPFHLFRFTK